MVKAVDENNNTLQAEEAEYLKNEDLLNSFGLTKIITKEKYLLESKNVVFDNKNKIIKSDFPTKIFDPDGNEIIVTMFNYNSIKNILFSQGKNPICYASFGENRRKSENRRKFDPKLFKRLKQTECKNQSDIKFCPRGCLG